MCVIIGCKVVEFCLDIVWDKGKVFDWIGEWFGLVEVGFDLWLLIYIGDDFIDEDVFDVVCFIGVGIVVCYNEYGD